MQTIEITSDDLPEILRGKLKGSTVVNNISIISSGISFELADALDLLDFSTVDTTTPQSTKEGVLHKIRSALQS